MKSAKILIDKLVPYADNPRKISDFMLGKLVESVLTFSEMLDLRKIVVDKGYVIIGGNQRYKALKKILDMSVEQIESALQSQRSYRDLPFQSQENILNKWLDWKSNPVVDVLVADDFSDLERSEFIVRDNTHFGDDDVSVIKECYCVEDLEEYYGTVSHDFFDFNDRINDEQLDIEATSTKKIKVGYLEAVLTDEEYDSLVELYQEYLSLAKPEIGFINFLLCK